MPEVNDPHNVMQSTNLTVQKVIKHVKKFKGAVNRVRNSSVTGYAKIFLSFRKTSLLQCKGKRCRKV